MSLFPHKIQNAVLSTILLSLLRTYTHAQPIVTYDVDWPTQSRNASESMPCGGGDIGLNVWVEQNELYFYIARSGTFDENNALAEARPYTCKALAQPLRGNGLPPAAHSE